MPAAEIIAIELILLLVLGLRLCKCAVDPDKLSLLIKGMLAD